MGLTEKFKENSCKLILYVINETFHSYVNIKCLGIFFPFSSFPLTELPLPDLHYMFVCFMGWWVGWHGGIFSWEEELIAESCDSFTEQTAVLPPIHPSSDVHPTPGEELPEGNCLPLPQLLKLSVHFLNENALSWAEPPHAQAKAEVWIRAPPPPPPGQLHGGEPPLRQRDVADGQRQPRLKVPEQDFAGLTSYRVVPLPQQYLFRAGAGCWWL